MIWRLRSIAVCSLLTAIAFIQDPGLTAADTKVDLVVNPAGWLARALHLWNPITNFGEVQNQAYGYLWPMGPFFAAGAALDIPAWAVQRLWWALLFCVAYMGIVALATRLAIGTPMARVIAGVAFALSPRLLTEVGSISIEAWPTAIAPWVLVPLAGLSRANAPLRRGLMLSALAVCCAGGVNATAVLATVPLALLWLAGLPGTPRRRLAAVSGWCLAVLCATAWWLVPLFLLGRFSPPFLDYIETASVTTRHTDLTSVLRGTSHWLAYLTGPYGPQLSAGHRLATEPLLLAATVAVAAIGVAGLARSGMPHRRFLIAGLLLGTGLVGFGHLSNLDTGMTGPVQDFLDGVGAPLRNVHKFDVLIRLPLALGLAHLVGVFARAAAISGHGWHLARRRSVVITAAALAAVTGAASPVVTAGLVNGGYQHVPGYWREAAAWLNANTGRDHVLIVPSARFPHYAWGSPTDEITQPLLERSWGVRNAIPLTPPGTIRMLDAIDAVLAGGAGSAGLADLLARNDIRYVVLRSDLDYGKTGTARPIQVRQALERSPGLERVESFGPDVGGGMVAGGHYDYGMHPPLPAIEVFKVRRPVYPVGLYDASAVTTVVGGPESLLELAATGQITGAPTILAGDLGAGRPPGPVAITDGLRHRDVLFGRGQDNASATLAADDPTAQTPVSDYLPSWASQWLTQARYLGISAVTASSSWATPHPDEGSRPEHLPFAAIDGDPATSWRTAPFRPAEGQWLELTLASPKRITEVAITFDLMADNVATQVLLVAGLQQATGEIDDGRAKFVLDGSLVSRVRVLITQAAGTLRTGQGGVGISEIAIPEVTATRSLVVAAGPATQRPASVVLSAAPSVSSCFFVQGSARCNPGVARGSEDAGRIDRTVTLPTAGSYTPSLWARPKPGPELDALIDKMVAGTTPAPVAKVSSRGVAEPAGRPGAVIDGDPSTAWYAADGDGSPSLRLAWAAPRTITGLRLALDPQVAATRPESITVVSSDGVRSGLLNSDGVIVFDRPIRTDEIAIFFLDRAPARSLDPYSMWSQPLPFAVGEVTALPDQPAVPANLDRRIELPCGSGPGVQAGGKTLQTKLSPTLRDLVELREVPASICVPAAGGTLALAAGEARIVVTGSALATPTTLALAAAATVAATQTLPEIGSWSANRRVLTVAAGEQPRVLVVRENTNPGWKATMGGFTLPAVVLDGWQQGWWIAPGLGGQVTLSYEPDRTFRVALASGGGLVAGVVLVAFIPARRRQTRPNRAARRTRPWLAVAVGAVGLALVGGPWAVLIALTVIVALSAYRLARHDVSKVDRRRVRVSVSWLRLWLPPLLVCLAGLASWRSATPELDALAQLLALGAMVVLWLSMTAWPLPQRRPR
ncbi:coagulation factor 5/8 type [Rhizocola hellebori]|uniref:Coagulation factor 5/8 type n=2 Tax=Rhizocola hellebori TaxID=1392758 RepID=A0A8J3QAZ8_9ACTN|nr:coagulation factor 5/8 type [Rhizocola hellebori]